MTSAKPGAAYRPYSDVPPTPWENEFADALEATFAAGTHDLAGVVDRLNKSRLKAPDGTDWTAESFQAVLKDLAGRK